MYFVFVHPKIVEENALLIIRVSRVPTNLKTVPLSLEALRCNRQFHVVLSFAHYLSVAFLKLEFITRFLMTWCLKPPNSCEILFLASVYAEITHERTGRKI